MSNWGLSEDMEALDVWGRHLGSQGIQCGLYEGDEEEYELDDLWITTILRWILGVSLHKWAFFENLNLTLFFAYEENTL